MYNYVYMYTYVCMYSYFCSATIELLDFNGMEVLTDNGPEISAIKRDNNYDNYLVYINIDI